MLQVLRPLFFLLLLSNSNVFAASLVDLDFMTGRWQNRASDAVIEEWWMASAGNTKVAAFRWARGDQIIAIELVIISQEDDGVFLRFKHYGADYEPWEKDEPNAYKLVSVEGDEAVFTQVSSNDKVPNVMIYRLTGDELEFRGKEDADSDDTDSDFVIKFRRAGN